MQTIALVDDDRNILELYVSMALEAEGYRIMRTPTAHRRWTVLNVAPGSCDPGHQDAAHGWHGDFAAPAPENQTFPSFSSTSKDEEIDELFGLKMGADDFIRKPFSQRLLVERVKAVLRRSESERRYASKEVDTAKVSGTRPAAHGPRATYLHVGKGEPVTLTVTEFLILQAIATRPGVVKSRNALMDAAYDDQVYVDDRTIDSHIKRLRKKFKVVDDDFEMIETLYGVGYRFKE